MKSGRLDTPIKIQRRSVTVDPTGAQLEMWSDLVTLRAELLKQTGREFVSSGAGFTERRAVFRARFANGPTTDDRLVSDGLVFDIVDIREIGRRRGLEFHCVERA